MTNQEFLLNWLKMIWLDNDFIAAERAFSKETSTAHIAGELALRANDYETMVCAICENFRPERIELSNVVEEGTRISAQMTLSGHRLDTEAEIALNVHIFREIVEGKFVRSASFPDYIGFYTALGQLPPDIMSTLMMGGQLHE
ncbi:MAG: hypothetical protein AAGA08_02465 [Pseudomonadota bacterium]